MNNKLILRLDEIISKADTTKTSGKKVGLITGSFDIIHRGHVDLVRQAKAKADLLIVGLENDFNIKRVKGQDRPFHTQFDRAEVLSELRSIDCIFLIDQEFQVYDDHADQYYQNLLSVINPNYLFTSAIKDKYMQTKQEKTTKLGIQLIDIEPQHEVSTTTIATKLAHEL